MHVLFEKWCFLEIWLPTNYIRSFTHKERGHNLTIVDDTR